MWNAAKDGRRGCHAAQSLNHLDAFPHFVFRDPEHDEIPSVVSQSGDPSAFLADRHDSVFILQKGDKDISFPFVLLPKE